MNTLVLDLGGSGVKFGHWCTTKSGVNRLLKHGKYKMEKYSPSMVLDAVESILPGINKIVVGVPAPVKDNIVQTNPANLGDGWCDLDLSSWLGVKTIGYNDAAMQALGAYSSLYSKHTEQDSDAMLYLGFGTGLGTALVAGRTRAIVLPLEAGHLPAERKKSFEQLVCNKVYKADFKTWVANSSIAIERLACAFLPKFVVLGGGNSKHLPIERITKSLRKDHNIDLPILLGTNRHALVGGVILSNKSG